MVTIHSCLEVLIPTCLHCSHQFWVQQDIINHFGSIDVSFEVGVAMGFKSWVQQPTFSAQSGHASGILTQSFIEVPTHND